MTMPTTMLPALDDYKPLLQENLDEFASKGHTLIRGVLSADELAIYRPVIVAAAEKVMKRVK